MRRSSTPWRPRPEIRATACATRPAARPGRLGRLGLAALVGLVAAACVSEGSYERLLDERDEILTERQALTERVDRLEAQNTRLTSQQERLETANASLSAERVELLESVENLRAERERLQGQVARLGKTREELGSELAKQEGQLEEREELLEARSRELTALSQKLEARTQELNQRTEELEARDAELHELKQTYEAFVGDLENEIAEGRIKIDQLRQGVRVNLPDATFFNPDSVELTMHGKVTLAKVAAQLRPMPHQVEVQGHTDDLPVRPALADRYPSNWDVAAARASAVVRQLVAHGIAPERIRAVSYGGSRPVAPNDTEEDRARNRRIEIRLIPVEAAQSPLSASLSAPRAAPRRVDKTHDASAPADPTPAPSRDRLGAPAR
jgi:chemotaxis protein MotB